MATDKNFIVKNGLEVGGQEVISSSGVVSSAALGGQTLGTTDSPTFANTTLTGSLRGPATFTIDPAAVGDNTGTLVIAGNLQVDGTTTTINSTTMEVDDLNITLASGAANAAAANGAGITVDGASATFTYDGTNDEWDFNKDINVTGTITFDGGTTSADLNFGDNDKAVFGAGSDLQIYHDGSNSFIDDAGTGNLQIRGTQVKLQKYTGENMFVGISDGAASMYYDNSQKIATTSTGIDVTGTATMDGLTVDGDASISSANARLRLFETDTTDLNTQFQNQAGDFFIKTIPDDASSSTSRFGIDHSTGDISFYEDTGTTAKFFWDASAERLGIGTTSPSAPLHVGGEAYFDAGTRHYTYDDQANFWSLYTNTDDSFRFNYNGAGADEVVIDTSGNLLVGQTTASSGTVGTSLRADGRTFFCADGNYAAHFNRNTSDGAIAHFAKNDSIVGSIGTNGGYIYVGSGDTNLRFHAGADAILPANAGGATRSAAIDLGTSGAKFKDIHLSGGAYVDTAVGIGTNAPDHDLHIETTDPTLILAQSGSLNSPNSGRILFAESPSYTTNNAHFEIKYDGSENHLYFGSPLDSSTNLFVVGRDGNVGIGTTNPGSILDIRETNSGGVGPTLSLINGASVANGNAVDINMAGNPGGGALAPTGRIRLTEDASAIPTLGFHLYDGSALGERMTLRHLGGTTLKLSGYASMLRLKSGAGAVFGHNVEATNTSNEIIQSNTGYYGSFIKMYYNQGIAFHTISSAGTTGDVIDSPAVSGTQRMRIDSAGRVGIGTDSPAAVLHISKDVGNTELEALRLSNFDPDQPNNQIGHAVSLSFELPANDGGNTDGKLAAKIVGLTGANLTNDWYTNSASTNFQGQLDFYTRNDDVLTNQMTLNENGFLGIGTTNPSVKLHLHSTVEEVLRIDSGNTGSIHFFENSTRRGIIGYSNGSSILTNASAGDMTLRAESGKNIHLGISGTSYVTLNSSGQTLINTTDGNMPTAGGNANCIVYGGAGNGFTYNALHVGGGRISLNAQPNSNSTRGYVQCDGAGFKLWHVDNSDMIFGVNNSEKMRIQQADGRIKSQPTYDNAAPATHRDVYVENSGQLGYASSVRAHKTNINSYGDASWLYQIDPKTFNYRKPNTTTFTNGEGHTEEVRDGTYSDTEYYDNVEVGLIAEDVEEHDPNLCFYNEVEDEDGNVTNELAGIHYKSMVVPMLKLIQELKAELDAAKARITELEG